jgi:hypothetical protein
VLLAIPPAGQHGEKNPDEGAVHAARVYISDRVLIPQEVRPTRGTLRDAGTAGTMTLDEYRPHVRQRRAARARR